MPLELRFFQYENGNIIPFSKEVPSKNVLINDFMSKHFSFYLFQNQYRGISLESDNFFEADFDISDDDMVYTIDFSGKWLKMTVDDAVKYTKTYGFSHFSRISFYTKESKGKNEGEYEKPHMISQPADESPSSSSSLTPAPTTRFGWPATSPLARSARELSGCVASSMTTTTP